MGYYDFPHTRNFDTDLSFLIKQYKELIEKVDGIKTDILEQANKYTDEQIATALNEINVLIADINRQYKEFIDKINLDISLITQKVDSETQKNIDRINALSLEVDTRILANNTYIFDQIAKDLIDIKVINYFTGAIVTIQEMFDYLAIFHLEDAISYEQLEVRNVTYNELTGLYITYTDLAKRGNIIL